MFAGIYWFTILIIILTLIPIHMINFVINHLAVSLDKIVNLHPLTSTSIFQILVIHTVRWLLSSALDIFTIIQVRMIIF